MKITFISDTHNTNLDRVSEDLPGGDILIHCGDVSSRGYYEEIAPFLRWFDKQSYRYKIFIAGNHDWLFEDRTASIAKELLKQFPDIIYLQDSFVMVEGIKIYGSPWQPEFYNWAFNLPRNGEKLQEKWDMIPEDTDILITHGPPFGTLDTVIDKRDIHLGCELLAERIEKIKPKIHVSGHIHTGRGMTEKNGIIYINASLLNEQYRYEFKPITIEYEEVKLKN